ncbi:MAG: FAD-binding oxidoreductase [Eggerthellaceae bacterium]
MPSSCAVSTVQVKPFFDEAAPCRAADDGGEPYRPWPARITSIIDVTETEKLFEFRLIDERIRDAFSHEPGQFVEVSIFGVGEAPISISSSPSKRGFIELTVRRAGAFTQALHRMQCGDIVGLRGPFGRGFPFEDMKGHDILLVAGGLGIALCARSSTTSTTSVPSSARSPSSTVRRTPPR